MKEKKTAEMEWKPAAGEIDMVRFNLAMIVRKAGSLKKLENDLSHFEDIFEKDKKPDVFSTKFKKVLARLRKAISNGDLTYEDKKAVFKNPEEDYELIATHFFQRMEEKEEVKSTHVEDEFIQWPRLYIEAEKGEVISLAWSYPYDDIFLEEKEITIESNDVVKTFKNKNGFTVQEVLDCVLKIEQIARPETDWFDGIDLHHIFFEGLHLEERKDKDVYVAVWGS